MPLNLMKSFLDDMSHVPWVWIQCKIFAFALTNFIILVRDGATSFLSEGVVQPCDNNSDMWKNVWVSRNKDRQCISSSLSDVLYFMGCNTSGSEIFNIRNIYHDKLQCFLAHQGNLLLDWMI